MTVQLAFTAAALVLGLAALLKWRQAERRLEQLAESYWELRYQCGQLQSRLARLEGHAPDDALPGSPDPAYVPSAASFVPLSSLKR